MVLAHCTSCNKKKHSSFFRRIPTNAEKKAEWERILGLENVREQARFCDLHFDSVFSKNPTSKMSGSYWKLDETTPRAKRTFKRFEKRNEQKDTEKIKEEKIQKLQEQNQKLNDSLERLRHRIKMLRNNNKVNTSTLMRVEYFKDNVSALFHFFTVKKIEDVRAIAIKVEERIGRSKISYKLDLINCVGVVLMRSRRGFKYETLAHLFNVSVSTIKRIIKVLLPHIVSILEEKGLGFLEKDQISSISIPKLREYAIPDNTLIMDCTYIYLEHSGNFSIQYHSFSSHKFRNLLKFLVLCYPNGRIAQTYGPYAAEDDDFITQDIIKKNDFKTALKNVSCVIVDRGFRLEKVFDEFGVKVIRPEYLHGRVQFDADEVENNRLVTSIRSVIENCNARIKYQRILHYPYNNKEIDSIELWFRLSSCMQGSNINEF